MADRTEPEYHNEPVVSPQAAAPTEAEIHSTPEISAPMLDVHPPHESIHTWRSFFIHVATIVVGLRRQICRATVEANHHQEFHDLMATMSVQSLTDWDAINAAHRFDVIDSDPTRLSPARVDEVIQLIETILAKHFQLGQSFGR